MISGGLNLSGRHQLPVIRQNEVAECGLACLAMIATYYGFRTDVATLRRKFGTSLQGVTLKSMIETATQLELASRPIQVPLKLLKEVRLPAIIHWDMKHFVVLKSISRKKFIIHDPALGERIYSQAELSAHFSGIALELLPSNKFKKRVEAVRLNLNSFWDRIYGLKRNLVQVFILSIVLQIFVLISPFFLQIAVDEALSKLDAELLYVLALGFAGIAIINFITGILRAYVLLYFGSMLSYQMVSNLFRHLIKLPIEFFEKRHIGDIVSRFGSMEPVRQMISEGFIAGIIDGLMAVTTLVMMFAFSPILAVIAFSAWLLYLSLRLAFYRPYRSAQEDVIVSQARENTTFIETVRGMTSIKLMASENDRENIWQNRLAEVINSNAKLGKLGIWFQNTNQIIFGIEHVILIYVGIRMVMTGEFSVGMLFAFMAYKRNFTEKASALVEKTIEYRMLGLHLERITDIAYSEPEEQGVNGIENSRQKTPCGKLELKNVCYRYSQQSPEILKRVNLSINSGDSVAIIGASGCGKTTLLKLMTSLFKPTSGQILLNDQPLNKYGLSNYRKQIGVVMQEDSLFAGSIADNIACFGAEMDMQGVISAARLAMIHNDIEIMPMQYESLIGDMGSSLSSGQKQRIILARALYRLPQFLFIDEGTAHLDVSTERRVNESLTNLGVTRVIVAHRPETIQYVNRILLLEEGVLEDVSKIVAVGPDGCA